MRDLGGKSKIKNQKAKLRYPKGMIFLLGGFWVPANNMRGSPLCFEDLRVATNGDFGGEGISVGGNAI